MTLPLLLALLLAPAEESPPKIPTVVLSTLHQEMCRVGVGDALPPLALNLPSGDPANLAELAGARATVVAFYQDDGWMTKQLRADLARDIARPYEGRRVRVVAIHVGGAADQDAPYPELADPEGEAFAKVGSGRLPRVYVLGPAQDGQPGEIVWFDIEYSRSTRRELHQTLQALTGGSVARRE